MRERPAGERDAANCLSGLQGPALGDDIALAQVGHEQVEAAEPKIALEDRPHPLGLGLTHAAVLMQHLLGQTPTSSKTPVRDETVHPNMHKT